MFMATLLRDVRYAVRVLSKSPGFTTVALVALALGIGANTAIFTVVNAVLLRALPFKDPDRLVMVWEKQPQVKRPNVVNSWNFLDWRARNRVFEKIAALHQLPLNLSSDGEPEQVIALRVSADFFPILGVNPIAGRVFLPEEDTPAGSHSTLLSYGLWQRRFGGDPNIVGRRVQINTQSYAIVGVMPPGFAFPAVKADLWIPIAINPVAAQRDGRNFSTVARLKPGVTLAQAQAEMESIAQKLAEERPRMNAKWSATVVPLKEQAVGEVRTALLVLLAAVGFVMLIACANIANLLLMRATGRRREISIRAALGAARSRIVRQLLVESVLLSTCGGILGLLTAMWGVRALLSLIPQDIPLPRMGEIRMDAAVFAFTLLLSFATGLLFGLVPAWQISRTDLQEGLRQGGRSGAGGGRRLRGALVIGEIAVALLLLIGAGLMIRSFVRLRNVSPGFQPERVLTMRLMIFQFSFQEAARQAAFLDQILTGVRNLPQVRAAASIHFLPLSGAHSGTGYFRADRPAPPPGSTTGGAVSVITPDYFRTMGIPLIKGRDFDARDRLDATPVLIISQTAAKLFYPNEDPIGHQLTVSWSGKNPREIIGVAGDVRHDGLNYEPQPTIYLAYAQNPLVFANVVVRSSADPAALARAIQSEIHAVDRNQPVSEVKTMDTVLSESVARPRLESVLLAMFAALALILACVGIYGVISYSVSQRTQEIGLRMALGAQPRNVLRLVLGEGMLLALAGVAAGLIAARLLTRYLATLLFGVTVTDPVIFAGVSALLLAVSVLACYIPARRATRVDPMVALRYE
jgi:putative ABC transport system permease protein